MGGTTLLDNHFSYNGEVWIKTGWESEAIADMVEEAVGRVKPDVLVVGLAVEDEIAVLLALDSDLPVAIIKL